MHKLIPPSISGQDAFNAAVATIRLSASRQPYQNATSAVATCCDRYDQLAERAQFNGANFAVEGLSVDAMVNLYERQFVNNLGTKPIRDSLQNASPNGLCPYCGEGSVRELDHYLPKRPFGGIAVHPANLVPVCRDCNRAKSDFSPGDGKPAVLHPYFDSAWDIHWLYASLTRTANGKPVAKFEVRLSESDPILESRLDAHMRVFDLYSRFRISAGQALNDFELLLTSPLGSALDLHAAKYHLRMTAVQQSGGRTNSWERALYDAMAADDWYLRTHLSLG